MQVFDICRDVSCAVLRISPIPRKLGGSCLLCGRSMFRHTSLATTISIAPTLLYHIYTSAMAPFRSLGGYRHWQAVSVSGDSLTRRMGAKLLRCAKREIEGNNATKILLWRIAVCNDTETFPAPSERIDGAREFPGRSVTSLGLHVYPLGGCVNYVVILSSGPSVTVRRPLRRRNWPASCV